MKQIKLFTSGGQYVTDVLVAEMNPMPEIVQWGSRMFVKQTDSTYTEGLLVIAIDSLDTTSES